jgi:hypothetical protein
VVEARRAPLEDEATTTTPRAAATFASASLVGPGTGSAKSKRACSSDWQKYGVRKSSWRQTSSAPRMAASSMPAIARARFAPASSGTQRICTSPTRSVRAGVPVRAVMARELGHGLAGRN